MTAKQTSPRSFAEIPQGSVVCVDANVLAYHFIEINQLTAASTLLLERGLRKEIALVTTPQIVSDVIHRIMLYEARQQLAIPANQLATHLKQHPQVVQQLTQHLDIPSLLRRFQIDIRALTHVHLHAAKRFRRDYGLLANDSLLLGFMATERVQHLASNDRDFRRIPDVTLWIP
jgi:predicted nucleic acid-binding protein